MFGNGKALGGEVVIRSADWSQDAAAIAAIRREVFIREQSVPEDMEWETIDPACAWFVGLVEEEVVGIARLMPTGRIGRMAVCRNWRGKGVGSGLLSLALATARTRGLAEVELHAQSQAIGFYERFGFRVVGGEFFEAGIPHRQMKLSLGEN